MTEDISDVRGPEGLPRVWRIEFYENEAGQKPVLQWIKYELTPTKRRALGTAMRRVLQVHGPAVNRTAWGRPAAPGIFEFRVRMSGKEVLNLEAEIHGITLAEARRVSPSTPRRTSSSESSLRVTARRSFSSYTDTTRERTQASVGSSARSKRLAAVWPW
jgi:hypothetical protein